MEEEKIRELVQANIDQISIDEFCPNGGNPSLDDIDVQVYSIEEEEDTYIIRLAILYKSMMPGSCTSSGGDTIEHLEAEVMIEGEEVEFLLW